MSTILESVFLHYTNGTNSDKVYNIYLEEVAPNRYTVTAYNGRRGGTLITQLKTPAPVPYAEAKRIYDELEESKRNSRKSPYQLVSRDRQTATSGQTATAPTATIRPAPAATTRRTAPPLTTQSPTGYQPTNPKRISETEAMRLIKDERWVAQQKCDGVFMAVLYKKGQVLASNKRGCGVTVPPALSQALRQLVVASGCEVSLGLAGEYLDQSLHVFSVWEKNGSRLDSFPNHLRMALLERMETSYRAQMATAGRDVSPALKFIYTARTEEEKKSLVERLKAADAEGVIFRQTEDDVAVKWKFFEQAEVLLVANDDRRSAECFVYSVGLLTSLGHVTLPNQDVLGEIKAANQRNEKVIASVRYLYLSAPVARGGQLVQASFCRLRDDVVESSCTDKGLKVANKSVLTKKKAQSGHAQPSEEIAAAAAAAQEPETRIAA